MVSVMWAQPRAGSLLLERRAEVEPGCKVCLPSSHRCALRVLDGITGIVVISAF